MIRKYKGFYFIQKNKNEIVDGFKYCIALHFYSHERVESSFAVTIGRSSISNMKEYINWLLEVDVYIEHLQETSKAYCIKYEKGTL